MRVLWTLSAEQDRADIVDFIAQDNPLAAIRMDELFGTAVGRLAEHPLMGRSGHVPGTRESIPHESYQLVYEVMPTLCGSRPWYTPHACGRPPGRN
jgi:toxin ParE1/3/4